MKNYDLVSAIPDTTRAHHLLPTVSAAVRAATGLTLAPAAARAARAKYAAPVTCEPPLECCNPLMGTCVMPGMVCAQ
jgi:hypothetical protein